MRTTRRLFDKFREALISLPYGTIQHPNLQIGNSGGFSLYYIPFEDINRDARLALVGITPGPSQMAAAYEQSKRMLLAGKHRDEILFEVKRLYAFSGKDRRAQMMRKRLNEMIDHFGMQRCLGTLSVSTLWTTDYSKIYPTSVIPNAAFKNGRYFNGPFEDVLKSSLLRASFENEFIPSLQSLNANIRFVGMGPVVWDALLWCAREGHIKEGQLIGYFPHASTAAGSQFSYFLGRKGIAELQPKDPVRYRAKDLDAAYQRIAMNKNRLCN